MELVSPSCVEALQLISRNVDFTDKIFEVTVTNIVNFILNIGKDTGTDLSSVCTCDLDPAFKKQTIPAVMTLLIEAAKTDASSEELSLILDDCEFSEQRKAITLKLYESHKQQIRAKLAKIGTTAPHIVDIDWRLDYNLQNSHANKIMDLQYTIELKTDHSSIDKEKGIQFSCSREQLQDFVGKLKEAVKAVERASQS